MTSASTDLNRLHALDALRAAMMLLGLVLHSAAIGALLNGRRFKQRLPRVDVTTRTSKNGPPSPRLDEGR